MRNQCWSSNRNQIKNPIDWTDDAISSSVSRVFYNCREKGDSNKWNSIALHQIENVFENQSMFWTQNKIEWSQECVSIIAST